jgi:general secretion pathway protein J
MTAISRRRQRGMTLVEVMLATGILAMMMMLAWRTMSGTHGAREAFEDFEARNRELRMALGRMVYDFESAYLSRNEDQNASHPRTLFRARPVSSNISDLRFSTLGHRVLWADANESEQTVISYFLRKNKTGGQDLLRREQRRLSNLPPEDEPSEYDVLVHDLHRIKLEYWNWKNLDWQDTWDTTQSDGQRGWLPTRVRIALTIKRPGGKEQTLVTQARILMQEPLNFVQ